MLNGCSLSVLIIAGLSSLGMVGLQAYTIAIDYPLNIFSDSSVQYNWSGILSCIELGTAIGVLLLATVTAIPYLETLNIANRGPLKFATIYYAVFSLTSIVIAMYRLSETGILFDFGMCSRTEGDLVCPTVLYRTEMEIENVTDCKFNNFADSPAMWNTNGMPLIDWSDKTMYDKKSQSIIFEAYRIARGTSLSISKDEMTLYHDCWYWGCDSVCNDRHTINQILAYASCVVSIMYLALATLSGVQSGFDSDYKEVPQEIPLAEVKVIEPELSVPSPFLLPEPLPKPLPEPLPEPQGSESVSSGTSAGSGSTSWKLRLRM